MKDMTTKELKKHLPLFITSLLCLSSCEAKIYNDVDSLIPEKTVTASQAPPPLPPPVPSPKVPKIEEDIEIKKSKNGDLVVPWKILAEYDLENKKEGKNLKKIINKSIVIKGHMIPLDYSAKSIKEFLLVPYMPNCAHVPPPPANMIVNVKVKGKKNLKASYYPVEIIGKIRMAKKSGKENPYMPTGVYSMITSSIKEIKP